MQKFVKNDPYPNFLFKLNEADFLSYNAAPHKGHAALEADGKGDETAGRINNKWFILNGDFREQYENAYDLHGRNGILQVWEDNKVKFASSWSTPETMEDALKWALEREKNLNS